MAVPRDTIRRELAAIRDNNDGVLRPAVVVEAARPKRHPLHDLFQWDDTQAARQYREWQARKIIATVYVDVVRGKAIQPVRAYVSLRRDRREEAGGYRDTVEVMSRAETRAELLAEALRDFAFFEAKYAHLTELAEVFAAARKVRGRAKPTAAYAA